ncbi:Ig-like domain-containing protein [Pseudomonas sp. FW300-N2F2]|uniref:Ig-like domain-containing protein n=1 Tax=Pseudomonas sp. FW300-N2F2 TaxID=2751320 RepID=UPI001A9344A0|nr:Ig-like domain-containing protein [Pseudomonas sp. FW300-N2F2]
MDTADNTPLLYDELKIPDGSPAHPPAPAGSIGINIAAAMLVFPHKGLKLRIPPWDNMGRGDAFRIKLDNIPVLTGSINEETEVGQWVERYIPVGGLIDGDFNLNYDVKILGEPDYRPSAVTKIHVKITNAPPGGKDQDGDTPGHSELRLTIPTEFLPPGFVDQEAAEQGVEVTIEPYPIMVEGDRIKLSWGGEIIWKTVESEHLPPQRTPLIITVDEATILKAGDTDTNGLAVVFEVYDVVDNKSEDWSAEVRVIVDTGNSRLEAPLIKELVNLVLDVDRLGEADLTFQIIATDTNAFKVGDEVEMHLTGTTAEGEKIEEVIFASEKLLSVPSILEFKRPSADVRQLAGGPHAAFFYRLIKADGSDDLTSKILSPRIVGRANPLAAPIPLDEIAGTLDPQLPSTTIEIPLDPAMEEGNAIALIWNGTTETGSAYTPDLPLHPLSQNEAEGTVPIEIVVAGEHLTAINGGTLDLYYKLLRDAVSREVIEDESLHADLLSIGLPLAELPVPVVEGESEGVLDPADKPDGTRLIVRQYGGQKAGDRVHILWWGSNTGRYRDSIRVTEITETQNIPFTISAPLIEGNRDGTVRAMYWVRRHDGRTSPSEILQMRIGAGMELTAPSVKQATGNSPTQQLNPVTAKDALTVVIPDYGTQPGDKVSVTWAGTAGAGSYTTPVGDLPASREIDLPVSVLAYNLARSVTVTYTVTRDGREEPPSAPLTLAVQAMPESSLAMPLIREAAQGGIGSELNLGSFTGDARVTAAPWPLIAAGQRVWLRCEGTASDGSNHTITLYTGSEVIPSEVGPGLSKAIQRVELEKLRDGSELKVVLEVTFNRSSNQSEAVTFPLRTYTVKTLELIRPTIDSAKDPHQAPITNGGYTVETSVTLGGRATKGQKVEVHEGDDLKGTADVNGDGVWSLTVSGLSVAPHIFTAKALYGNNPISDAWGINVVAVVQPTITAIKDPNNADIPNGGYTLSTSVTLHGRASLGMQVQIFEGADLKGIADVDGYGDWSLPLSGLAEGPHIVNAKALYSNQPESDYRGFNVAKQLVVDTGPVYLSGFFLYIGQPRNGTPMPAGTTFNRTPLSGNPGYAYYTSNGNVARVDGYGTVEGWANGQATITVADASGQTASYSVIRSNAWQMAMIGTITGGEAANWANSQGAANSFAQPPRPDGGTMEAIRTYYVVPTGFNYRHWTGAFENGNPLWPLWANPYTGEIGTQAIQDYLGAYCRIPYNAGQVLASIPDSQPDTDQR